MEPVNGKHILLADDEQFIAIAYKDGLERAGYSVTVAHDGSEVVEILENGSRPDLLLLDLIMPKMNGFEVLKAIHDNPALTGMPIIVLTNLGQSSDEAEVRTYNVTDFIVKADISLKDLLARIERVFTTVAAPQVAEPAPTTTATSENAAPALSEAPDIDLSEEEKPSE